MKVNFIGGLLWSYKTYKIRRSHRRIIRPWVKPNIDVGIPPILKNEWSALQNTEDKTFTRILT